MATKTISVTLEAYEKLKRARRYERESFSQVVLRASWPEASITGAELLHRLRSTPPQLSAVELDAIETAIGNDAAAADKWQR